ncbi:MAG: hypothetical protein LBK95_13845 [Bifidobacteriaceae bacterium]|jgi:hypothetical protein|nr:hypothetical protein [Bifidobacteriaceae bacterium]
MTEPNGWTQDQPTVTVVVCADDTLDFKVFGEPWEPPGVQGRMRRGQLGWAMDRLWERFGQWFTVELVDADGTRRRGVVDLSQAAAPGAAADAGAPQSGAVDLGRDGASAAGDQPSARAGAEALWGPPAEGPARPARHAALLEPQRAAEPERGGWPAVAGDGFEPGEDVLVAYVAAAVPADAWGRVSAEVPPEAAAWLPTGEIVLFGRRAGTVAVRAIAERG